MENIENIEELEILLSTEILDNKMPTFDDLSTTTLRKVIRFYRLHLLKDINGFSKKSRAELLEICNKMFNISNNGIELKARDPITFKFKEKQPKKPKVEPKKTLKKEKTKAISKLFIRVANKQVLDNLPHGLETLIILDFEHHNNEKNDNLPSSLKHIYISTSQKRIRTEGTIMGYFPKLPFGCHIEFIYFVGEDRNVEYRTKENGNDKVDENIFNNPVFGYSKLEKAYVELPVKKEKQKGVNGVQDVYIIAEKDLVALDVQ